MFGGFFPGKRVLVTGHTGFKGSWLSVWLNELGAEVHGFALAPESPDNLFDLVAAPACRTSTIADLRDIDAVRRTVRAVKPDVVLHLAAQALVLRSYEQPLDTLHTNAVGTANLLEALRDYSAPCTAVIVTSDKCYQNNETGRAYSESDPLGGNDIYSMSKAAAELVAHAWSTSFFAPNAHPVRLATARAGNVIGGGDDAADRIVPDSMRSLAAGEPIRVRNPRAVRPWQHVLESLSGYLWLAARTAAEAKRPDLRSYNFGPTTAANRRVEELVAYILRCWPGEWVDASDPNAPKKEAHTLQLSIERAQRELAWQPVWDFETTVEKTVDWYRAQRSEKSAFTVRQIGDYAGAAKAAGVKWAQE